MRFRGHCGLQKASEVRSDVRFETYGPNYICYHVCLDCFGPFLSFVRKKEERTFASTRAVDFAATKKALCCCKYHQLMLQGLKNKLSWSPIITFTESVGHSYASSSAVVSASKRQIPIGAESPFTALVNTQQLSAAIVPAKFAAFHIQQEEEEGQHGPRMLSSKVERRGHQSESLAVSFCSIWHIS